MDHTRLLPEDLLLDVLRRLPPASLAVSRWVCKAWRAAVDDHRADLLLTLSLEGIFLKLHDPYVTPENRWWQDYPIPVLFPRRQEYPIPVLFSRPSTGRKIPTNIGYPDNEFDHRFILDSCNGLLLLTNDRVVNPATRQWAKVPPLSSLTTRFYWCTYSKYLVFDPTVSPHYEVVSVPTIPDNLSTGNIGKHDCKDMSVSAMEWPPNPYIMDVFSSTTGEWEERSFVREGKPIGTVAECTAGYRVYQGSAYWHGSLYVNCGDDFVLRIKLWDNTYQVIEPPREMERFYECRLGKSEKGVYCAYCCDSDMFAIWFLDESHGHTEWLFKTDINLEQVALRHRDIGMGSWTLQKYAEYALEKTSEEYALEEKSAWDPDDKDVTSIEQWVELQDGARYDFLGFHPDKEVAILYSSSDLVMACDLNTSKARGLGYLHLQAQGHVIDLSFPYTPCWMGPLPGSSKNLI